MNTYDIINKAADFIEANPQQYRFMSYCVPRGPGDNGCALGWIGFFADKNLGGLTVIPVALVLGLKAEDEFYDRMRSLLGGYRWHHEAAECVRGLRLYAEKYHTNAVLPPPRQGLPAKILSIFGIKPKALT